LKPEVREAEMKIGREIDVDAKPAEVDEAKGVGMKVLMSEKDGAPTSVMRVFDVAPGGYTPFHTHDWEHEVYVLQGKGAVKEGEKEHALENGSFVLVQPGEEHQFINRGDDVLRFICVVPVPKK
jgi:quercetin dioxygenase-like cupin family protein